MDQEFFRENFELTSQLVPNSYDTYRTFKSDFIYAVYRRTSKESARRVQALAKRYEWVGRFRPIMAQRRRSTPRDVDVLIDRVNEVIRSISAPSVVPRMLSKGRGAWDRLTDFLVVVDCKFLGAKFNDYCNLENIIPENEVIEVYWDFNCGVVFKSKTWYEDEEWCSESDYLNEYGDLACDMEFFDELVAKIA